MDKGCFCPSRYKTNVMAQWMARDVHGGPRLHIRKSFTHTSTHTHTSPAFHSSQRRPFSLPGKRNPIHSPIKHRRPHLTRRGQGPCPLTLVCQLTDSTGGGAPTFPCPSALLTGAGRQGTPPPPHSCPSAHLMDVGRWGVPRGSQPWGRRISALGGRRLEPTPSSR